MNDKRYMAINTCKRCRHKWVNRKPRKPKMCPKCKSVNWDGKEEA